MGKFSGSFNLPDYLEEALDPLSWSGLFSKRFRSDIIGCLCAPVPSRKTVINDFVAGLRLMKFLDHNWVEKLSTALMRFAEEGFKPR